MRRALFLVFAVGCTTNTVQTPIRSFDRPADVALACARLEHGIFWRPVPLANCDPNLKQSDEEAIDAVLAAHGGAVPDGGVESSGQLKALVVNSARGELALVDAENELTPIQDLYKTVPGFGFLPVGSLPEHVRASADGLKGLTSNTDSCDLAVVELETLYNMPLLQTFDAGVADGGFDPASVSDVVHRLTITVADGIPLAARPTWIEFAPESANQTDTTSTNPCIGPGKYCAWVALPGCGMIAEVDLISHLAQAEARVQRAIRLTATGAEIITDPTTLSCPVECGDITDGGSTTAIPDLSGTTNTDGGADGGVGISSTPYPTGFAIETPDINQPSSGLRMIIGDLSSESLHIIPFDAESGAFGTPHSLPLESGALGVSVVRISPRTPAGKFAYAVARDRSVRVIDLDRENECETNPDPRSVAGVPGIDPAPDARHLGCYPLGDPSTPPRSAEAISPGIVLLGGAIPRDVAFVHLDVPPPPPETNEEPTLAGPNLMVGDFAWLIGSDGHGTVINIYDACPAPNIPQQIGNTGTYFPSCDLNDNQPQLSRDLTIANYGAPQPRVLDRLAHRPRSGGNPFLQPPSPGDPSGEPRLQDETNPFVNTPVGSTLTDTAGRAVDPTTLPIMYGTENHHLLFPDPMQVRNETWDVTWEGELLGTGRSLGRPLEHGTILNDPGASYCSHGVLAGDKLVFLGCTDNSQCSYGQTCVFDDQRPFDVTNGLCLNANNQQMIADECSPLLRAHIRYRISSAKEGTVDEQGQRTDRLVIAEIYEPEHSDETKLCATDADCDSVTIAARGTSGVIVALGTQCLHDSDPSGTLRCLRACSTVPSTDDAHKDVGVCGDGYLCADAATGDQRCMRAPAALLNSDCMRENQPYDVIVGDAFIVSGSVSSTFVAVEPDPSTRECRRPTGGEINSQNSEFIRLHQSRIPLSAVACVSSDPLANVGISAPNVCQITDPTTGNRLLHFENPIFNLAIRVLAASNGEQALVPPDLFQLSFEVVGTGFPLSIQLGIDVTAQLPNTAITGPDRQTVYVIDEGKQSTATGLRGQLLRIFSVIQSVDHTFEVR